MILSELEVAIALDVSDDFVLVRPDGRRLESVSPSGYVYFYYGGKSRLSHRVIWTKFNGEIPDGFEVDHINHIRSDNRISNLRLVNRVENARNKSRASNNTSGVTGVSWIKSKGKWYAQIYVNGKTHNLGYYSDFNDAVKARIDAEDRFGFHKNHGKAK